MFITVYETTTGLISHTLSTDVYHEGVAPPGYSQLEGYSDPMAQKVVIIDEVPTIVDYIPDAPADTENYTYSWDTETKRYLATPTLLTRKTNKSRPLISQLNVLDTKVIRPAGEIAAAVASGVTIPETSVAILTDLNSQKIVIRSKLADINAATTVEELNAIN